VRIYVGSTFSDLQAHRDALRSALQALEETEYIGPEYLSATEQPSLEACQEAVRDAFALVLVLGWRYGYIAEGHEKSVVELEYEAALERTPVLCYVIDENYPIPAKFVETGENAERLRRFKDRIRREKVIKTFTSPEDLARQVAIDLTYAYKKPISAVTEDIVARPQLEKELARCKETAAAYESTIDALRSRLASVVPAVPIWMRRNFTVDGTLCFSLMPFQESFFCVYEEAILPAAKAAGMRSMHAGEIFDNREIIEDVWESICTARVVIADVTGRNPNVFYELGICHTLGKEVIVITQNRDDVPFDIRHRRFLEYGPDKLASLRSRLEKTIKNIILRTDSQKG